MAANNHRCIIPSGATRTRYDEKPNYVEGLYELGHNLYAWLVPNGSWGEANAGLIIGEGESLLVDTLWDVKYTQAMLDGMATLTEVASIKVVVNTHSRWRSFLGESTAGSL